MMIEKFKQFYMNSEYKPFRKQFLWLNNRIKRKEGIEFVERNGVELELDLSDSVQNGIFMNVYKASIIRVMNEQLKEGDVMFDFGGFIGYFSLIGSKLVGESGKVFCFEVNEENIKKIEKNIERNDAKNIEIINNAIGNQNRIVTIPTQTKYDVTTGKEIGDEKDVLMVTLDQFMKTNELEKIDFIKMDINGHEYEALLGMQETIEKYHPTIVFKFSCLLTDTEKQIEKYRNDVLNLIFSFKDYEFYSDVSACKVRLSKKDLRRILNERGANNVLMKYMGRCN